MAVTFTALTTGSDTTNQTGAYGTASITPTAGQPVLLSVLTTVGSGSTPTPTITGCGLTWTLVAQTATGSRTGWLFLGIGATPMAGGLSISGDGTTVTSSCLWQVTQCAGVDTTTASGVVQSVAAKPASAASVSVPFTATVAAGNGTFGAVGNSVQESPAAGSGWTTAGATNQSGPTSGLLAEFAAAAQQNITASWTTASTSFVVGVELAAAPSGGANAAAVGALTFGGTATAAAAAAATGGLAFGGTATPTTTAAMAAAIGLLTFGGTATATASARATGALTFGGTAAGSPAQLTITATPDPLFSPPRIRIDVADTRTSPITSITITRTNPDGHTYPVRTADGGPLVVSGGTATIYDYEAPYDSPITYLTDQAGGPTTVTELDVDDVWLIHTGVPSRSCQVKVTSLPQRTRATNSGLHKVLGASFPVPISSGARQAAAGPMSVRTYTDTDRTDLELALDDDTVLLLNIPPSKGWGWSPCYINCGDLTEARTVAFGPFPYREWQLPIQVVGRPAGGTQAAITWNTEASTYASWNAIKAAGITSWSQLTAPTT